MDVLGERDGDEAVVRQHGGRSEEGGADAGFDEVLDGVEIGRVMDHIRLAAERRVGAVHETVDEEAAVEQRERLLRELRHTYALPPGERMVGIRHEAALTGEELPIDEVVAEARLVVRHGEVELLVLDHVQRADAARLDDLEHDLGMRRAELAEDARQKARADLQRQRHADVVAVVREVVDLRLELLHLVEDVRDLAEQLAAVMREDELASLAVEEIEPRLRLHRLHGDGDRRLRHMQMLRRLRDVLPLADRIEIPHLCECHDVLLLSPT